MNNNEFYLAPSIIRLAEKIKYEDFVVDKSGVKLVELLSAKFILDPSQPILNFGDIRKTPVKYCAKELIWYLSESLSVEEIGKTASIWNEVASEDGMINSNYGWCVYSEENYNQFDNVAQELINFPQSRRAVIIYNRPSMWKDYNHNGMSDFMCTFATQHFIRNNELISVVNMRSNDLIFGFFNDFYWQCFVHNDLLHELNENGMNLKTGKIIWNANSLHVYERHFDMVQKIARWIDETRGI